MMFRILKANKDKNTNPMEVIRIAYFSPSYECNQPSDQVVSEIDVMIPLDAGSYVSAAMILGYRDNFLSKIMKPEDFDADTKELFAQAEKIIEDFKKQNSKLILTGQ